MNITSGEFVKNVEKAKTLFDEGVWSFTEFTQRVDFYINSVINYGTDLNKDDFLLKIIPLINRNIINEEQLAKIKSKLNENINVTESTQEESKYRNKVIKKSDPIREINYPEHKQKSNNSPIISANITYKLIITSIIILFLIIALLVLRSYSSNYFDSVDNVKISNENRNILSTQNNKVESPVREITSEDNVKQFIKDWISKTNSKDLSIRDLYAPTLSKYYTWKLASREKVMRDKKSFFNKWDDISIKIDNLSINPKSANEYECLYDKSFKSRTSSKSFEGKVRSRLVIEKTNGGFLITTESDDFSYKLDKSN